MSRKPVTHNPLTLEQVTGIPKDRHLGTPITCSECNTSGHTLIKDGRGGYKHQNTALCKVIQ